MTFTWNTSPPYFAYRQAGTATTGIVHEGKRPVAVTLDWHEMLYLQHHPDYIRPLKHALAF